MDFQSFVDCCAMPCAVFSVEKTPQGTCGAIRIVCANQLYKDIMGSGYYDGMLYEELVPKEPKFEESCFRAAIMGTKMHSYVTTPALGYWSDFTLIPLVHENENLGYCQFTIEITEGLEPERMADVSVDTASSAVKASIALMGSDDIRESAKVVLDDILAKSEGLSSRIVLIDVEQKKAYTLCESFCKGFFTDVELGEAVIPYDTVMSWKELIGSSDALIIQNERDMAEVEQNNPEWVQQLREFSVVSLVLIPLLRGSETIGYLYVTNFNVEKVVAVKELIGLMAYFLGAEISNYLLVDRLRKMSSIDGLTGMFNRRAMLGRMKQISESPEVKPFGIINIDLNGLKITNDTDGHDAGDALLVEASEILKKIFHEDDLFRTGGDEFIVICYDIDEEVFDRKVTRLRADVEKNSSVSFAIGAYWTDGSTGIRDAFLHADEMMYADKNAYYESHPHAQRR